MISGWLLWIWFASGEPPALVVQPTELACDRERAAIERSVLDAEHAGTCPWTIGAACTPILATPEFLEGDDD